MNEYIDVSFFEQKDQRFWDTSGNASKVSANIKLSCSCENYEMPISFSVSQIVVNLPVKYKDGIFRVKKVSFSDGVLEIEVEGTFSSSDPNGEISNGWKEEEIINIDARCVDNSIAELEV